MNINNFLSHIKKNGVAKTNRFKVEIFSPPYGVELAPFYNKESKDLEFSCESVEFPGRSLTTADNRIYGASYKTPYGTDYPEINLTFLCSENMNEKQFFDNWINFINPVYTFDFKYRNEYVTDMNIYQYNELNVPTYSVKLLGAYPTAIGSLQSNWSDDGIHKLQVTMTYRLWQELETKLPQAES